MYKILRHHITLLLFSFLLFACNDQHNGQGLATLVSVVKTEPKDIPLNYEYSGYTQGLKNVELRAQVGGTLLECKYRQGKIVKQGDVLFVIDPKPYKAAYGQAKASFIEKEAEWKRVKTLFTEQAISNKEKDQALSAYRQAEAYLELARVNLDHTEVRAPVTGISSNENFTEGNLVHPGTDSAYLTTITQLDPLYIYFYIPEDDILQQRKYHNNGIPDDLKITVENQEHVLKGEVDFIDSIVDTETGTVKARAILSNANNILLPGQFVRLKLEGIVFKNAIVIPDKSIMQGPNGIFVYVVDQDNKASIAPVKLGPLLKEGRVIESGLIKGQQVITDGMIKVVPGKLVKIDIEN
jgi:membrane fusion protein, multidrug efflux system